MASCIQTDCPVHHWNEEHPQHRVMPGHAIIAVNGAEDIKDMWLDGKDGGVWIVDVSNKKTKRNISQTRIINYQVYEPIECCIHSNIPQILSQHIQKKGKGKGAGYVIHESYGWWKPDFNFTRKMAIGNRVLIFRATGLTGMRIDVEEFWMSHWKKTVTQFLCYIYLHEWWIFLMGLII